MFKKLLLKSVVGATVAGSALAVSLVATPAVVTSAPEIQNVACTVKYPGSVSTTTRVSMSRSVGTYGQSATATATVSAGNRKPGGSVRFILSRSGGGIVKSWTVSLRRGQASVTLPPLGGRSTYRMRALYNAPDCSIFSRSGSSAYYTVNPANTRASVAAPNVSRPSSAQATAVVSSPCPARVTGKVRFTVIRNGNQVASETHSLSGERSSANLGKLRPGRYSVKVTYLGNRNFRRVSASDAFRVTR